MCQNLTPLFTPTTIELLSQAELLNNGTVALDVCFLKVAEKISSVANHLLQTAAAVVVLVIALEMLGQIFDSVSKKRDLNLGRTGVSFVSSVLLNNCLLFVFKHHGSFHLSINIYR